MADQTNDPTKFDMNAYHRIFNKERDKQLTFGAYNGQNQLSFGSAQFEKGVRPRNIQVTDTLRVVIIDNIRKILEAPAPDKKYPIIINGRWNQETRKRELSAVITIGMDETGICFIGVKHVNDNGENFVAKFELLGDRNIESDGYNDEKSRSLSTLRMLLNMISEHWPTTAMLTRNHMVKPTFNRDGKGGNKNYSRPSSVASSGSSDDDLF